MGLKGLNGCQGGARGTACTSAVVTIAVTNTSAQTCWQSAVMHHENESAAAGTIAMTPDRINEPFEL